MRAYDKAVQLLASRPHFRREMEAKLAARGFSPEEVAAALDRLADQGYLDDRRAAVDFMAARLARGGEGRRRLRAELMRRGAAPEAVEAALSELPEDDVSAARAAAERWRSHGGADGIGGMGHAALARHLDRKGFSRRAIVAVLKEAGPGGEDAADALDSDPPTDPTDPEP